MLTGFPKAIATFSHARPNADMPRKLIIQYTTNVPFPYALGFIAGSVGLEGPFEKGTWNASATKEYPRERKK